MRSKCVEVDWEEQLTMKEGVEALFWCGELWSHRNRAILWGTKTCTIHFYRSWAPRKPSASPPQKTEGWHWCYSQEEGVPHRGAVTQKWGAQKCESDLTQQERLYTNLHNSLQRMESVLGVTLSGNTAEVIRDDIFLCQLVNKLHPGMIQYVHEEVQTDTVTASNTSWSQTLLACICINDAFSRICTMTTVSTYF